MPRPLRPLVLACLLTGALGAWAQQGSAIYTCVDAKGRRLTSDRPIAACMDREQQVLNASGTVRRILEPVPTASERAAVQERERRLAEERQRLEEEKRLERALLGRYPNRAMHDKERAKAQQAPEEAIAGARSRIAQLGEQRRKLDTEAEFYKSPAQWPPALKRQVEDNQHQVEGQQRLIAAQQEEKRRIDARFDEELVRLKVLWAQAQGTAAASAPGPVKR